MNWEEHDLITNIVITLPNQNTFPTQTYVNP